MNESIVTFEKVIQKKMFIEGSLGVLVDEVNQLPNLRRLLAMMFFGLAYPILVCNGSTVEVDIDSLGEYCVKTPQDEHNLKCAFADARRLWISYMRAARKVNVLYWFPSALVVCSATILNMVSVCALSSPLIRAQWRLSYHRLTRDVGDPRWIRDCWLEQRPLWCTWILLVPKIAILLMFVHHVKSAIRGIKPTKTPTHVYGVECLRLRQNVDTSDDSHTVNFYNSPWFTIVVLLPFVLGLPGMVCLWIYWHFGVDFLLGQPSAAKDFNMVFKTIDMYIYPLGWCLSALFFRSYFTFATNFLSTEHDIEIYPDRIVDQPVKGWFADFLIFRVCHMPAQIDWKDVVSVRFESLSCVAKPKPEQPSWVQSLHKVTNLYVSLAKKLEVHSDLLEIETKHRSVKIQLWELTSEQKYRLFQAIRKHAPSVNLDANVQQALIGSSVLREPRYTEIWFTILEDGNLGTIDGDLPQGHRLQNDRFCIRAKVASGGQAVIYEAETKDGEFVILKEFQLTPGEAFATMIESARDFQNESTILSQLSHAAIVKQLEMFYEQGRVYIALEYVHGKSLRQHVQSCGPLSPDKIVDYAKQCADILGYLHSLEQF